MVLPDLLAPGLDLVLCGTAPSHASRAAAAYYAHPGNLFWTILHRTGLTPVRLAPSDYPRLVHYGIGLTDLNKTEWGADSDLSGAGFDVDGFVAKMEACRPALIAFDSKHAASRYFGRKTIVYGEQAERLAGARLFVVPSTSGRARGYFDAAPWHLLAGIVADRRALRGDIAEITAESAAAPDIH